MVAFIVDYVRIYEVVRRETCEDSSCIMAILEFVFNSGKLCEVAQINAKYIGCIKLKAKHLS